MAVSEATRFTILDDWRLVEVPARIADGRVRLGPDEAWIVAGRESGSEDADLHDLAARLGRPLALDVEERAAFLGVAAEARAQALAALEAPDFTLPDLDGRPHALAAHRGRKVLLLAYASW
jgi:hypothetical protein